MARLGVAVVSMSLVALIVAYLFFDWPALLIGVPAFVAIVLVVIAVLASEKPRRKLEEHRATRFDPAAQLPGGLMSGFFEVGRTPVQPPAPPEHRPIDVTVRRRP